MFCVFSFRGVLIFLVPILTLCFKQSIKKWTINAKTSKLFVIGNLGSDELNRPDDENSPEFQQYLQKLLLMQSQRAKAGYASPSSASADAYIAKLNRIKLERNARRAAGLSPDEVDTSYKPIDYESAMYETQEPLIRSVGSTGKGGTKVREVAAQELLVVRAAKEAVEMELQRKQAQPSSSLPQDTNKVNKFITPNSDIAKSKENKLPKEETVNSILPEIFVKRRSESRKNPPNIVSQKKFYSSLSSSNEEANDESDIEEASTNLQAETLKETTYQKPENNHQLPKKLKKFLMSPNLFSLEELNVLDAEMREALQQISDSIESTRKTKSYKSVKTSKVVDDQFMNRHYNQTPETNSENRSKLQLALGLMLKHKGGVGFGSGRLQGDDLKMLQDSLLKSIEIVKKMQEGGC